MAGLTVSKYVPSAGALHLPSMYSSKRSLSLTTDVLSGAGLPEALEGVDTAYYLVHSMGSGGDFAAKARQAAADLGEAAAQAGVRRVVYLGGLGSENSEHLRSRHEVATMLRVFKLRLTPTGAPLDPSDAPYVLNAATCDVELGEGSKIPKR